MIPTGRRGLKGVERALAKMNVPMVAKATVERNSKDVDAAVKAIFPLQPDAVIQISAYSSCAAFIKAMRAKGYYGQFHNVSFVGSQALADTLGDDGPGVVISQVVPFPWSQATPIVAEYTKAMLKAQKDINFSSLEGLYGCQIICGRLTASGA